MRPTSSILRPLFWPTLRLKHKLYTRTQSIYWLFSTWPYRWPIPLGLLTPFATRFHGSGIPVGSTPYRLSAAAHFSRLNAEGV